jgi:hypothetical protein
VAGIHLSGPNAKKSSVCILNITDSETYLVSLYEKIGSVGSLFSDERIIEILTRNAPVQGLYVDCPVSEPPCVSCVRDFCPGVVRCDDAAVGMMLALEQKRKRKGGHKLRPLNPQNLRLWDAMYARDSSFANLEPSYSANLAPLVVRAKTLQRRMRSVLPEITIAETNVPFLLRQLEQLWGESSWATGYRGFERGTDVREEILSELAGPRFGEHFGGHRLRLNDEGIDQISSSVENFHAAMAAFMALWSHLRMTRQRTPYFESNPGWVETLNIKQPKTF